jgi:hypothetical protein
MFARFGVLEMLALPLVMAVVIGPYRFGILVAYAAGLQTGTPGR